MGVGDFVGPLVFLGIAAYGVWAFANHQFPFNIDTSSLLGGGMTPDLSGGMLPTNGSTTDPCAGCCGGMTATGAAGFLSYAGKSKHHSKRSSRKKKHHKKGGGGGGGGGGTGSTDPCAMCNCGGGGGAVGGTGGGGGGPTWQQDPAFGANLPCPTIGVSCNQVGQRGGTKGPNKWCICSGGGGTATGAQGEILSEYAQYGDYSIGGGLIAADVPIAPDLWISNYARYGDYGLIGSDISRPVQFRSNYAKSGDYGAIGNLISRGGDVFRSFQGNYVDSDKYYPVQYGYLGTVPTSRLNQLSGIQAIAPTRNPLDEYVDRTVPVAVS